MTTIRDEVDKALRTGDHLNAPLLALGIDPDLPAGSILVLERPKCPTCGGTGWIAPTGHGMSHGDEGDPCPICKGTGYVPDPWATVDRCLDWLRARSWFLDYAMWNGDGFDVQFVVDARDHHGIAVSDRHTIAPTLHAALVAACKAVQEAQP